MLDKEEKRVIVDEELKQLIYKALFNGHIIHGSFGFEFNSSTKLNDIKMASKFWDLANKKHKRVPSTADFFKEHPEYIPKLYRLLAGENE